MLTDVVRMVADWLADPTYGVNAQLAALAAAGTLLDAGDPQPAAVAVFDETRDETAAYGRLPAARPCVVVSLAPLEFEIEVDVPQQTHRTFRPQLLIRYADADAETQHATRDAYTTARAILRSLHVLHTNAQASARARNQVLLVDCVSTRFLPLFKPMEDSEVTSALLLTYEARDLAA